MALMAVSKLARGKKSDSLRRCQILQPVTAREEPSSDQPIRPTIRAHQATRTRSRRWWQSPSYGAPSIGFKRRSLTEHRLQEAHRA
eukprot:5052902-Prymnesium_polylepis.1